MPEYTSEDSLNVVMRAIQLQASGAPKAECDAAALDVARVVRNSNSMIVARLTDQTIAENLDTILAQLQNQGEVLVGPPALPPAQGQLPAGNNDDIPF